MKAPVSLVDNWHLVLRYAWSVRLIVLAALLSCCEVAITIMVAYQVPTPIPPGVFAGLGGLVSGLAFIARFVAQKKTRK